MEDTREMLRRLVPPMALVMALLAGCVGGAVRVSLAPAADPEPAPSGAPARQPTAFPTPAEVAPERTFTEVGNVGSLEGTHGVQGQAVVAGLQTLIIQGFTFDGKGPAAEIRLVKAPDYASAAAVLATLEGRPYAGEFLLLTIPSSVTRENADRLVIYAPETGEVYAETTFQ